ncbi:MAG: hypothetical protein M3R07_04955, partial [Gemmatimonadota bacterium]|nr:hypothetical protein [Gemmatimonadota bacterium]
ANSNLILEQKRVIELRVLAKTAQQQRTRLLCCGRSAEEQGRHRSDGQTSSQHKKYLFEWWIQLSTPGTKMTANPLGRMHAREPAGDPDGSLYPRRNIADFSHRATQFPRWAYIEHVTDTSSG